MIYDPATNRWHETRPAGGPGPRARWGASMVYGSANRTVLLFGGLFGSYDGSDGLLADEWAYSPGRNTWKRLDAGPASPSRRDFGSAAYDPRAGLTILFGGLTGDTGNIDGTLLNDTWQRS